MFPSSGPLSMFVKLQELRIPFSFSKMGKPQQWASVPWDSPPGKQASPRELLKALKPYGNPGEQNLIDAANSLLEGQTPLEQIRRFLTPSQQARFETLQMVIAALQAMN